VFHRHPVKVLAAFDWSFIWENRAELWGGFKFTMKAAAVGIVGAFVIGLVLGAARAHRIPVLSQLAGVYVELIRNTPILVQIFFLYYGILPALGYRGDPFLAAWLSITIWGAAFNTENFRAGFEAVPARFREAGHALGFTPLQTFLNVTLPIGGRIALPSTINTFISVLKNTSLLLVIGYAELTYQANNIQALTFRTFEMFTVLAVVYLVIVWTLSALIRLLEARLALPERL
jgi:His/Glu/Gln/Arg/opine family amino acid ABC transporter permease subunit